MHFKLFLIVLLTALFFANASFQTHAQQIKKSTEEKCPLDFGDFIYPPNTVLESADAPAKVIATSAGARDGVMLAGVDLKNLSGKTITAVKFQWYLFRANQQEKITITKGETPIVDIDECQPKGTCVVDYSIVWCKDIYKALVENRSSGGELVIVAVASELSYKDGSKWKRNE